MRVVVVGGGPVGLFAAVTAAVRGHDVVVLERREGDGDKACGEGLMPSAARALAAIGVEPSGIPFSGIRYLDASGRHQVRADLRGGCGLGVRRTTLVAALRARAHETGVDMHQGSVADVGRDGSAAVVCTDGSRHEGDVVLGCDGLGSTVRSALGLDVPVTGTPRYGLVAHYAVEPWSTDVEVHWGSGGEAYVTPVGPGLVGVAALGGRGRSLPDRLSELHALRSRLDGAMQVGKVQGAGPLRRRASSPVRGPFALVGDAAGYVDALTGEGLAVGFRSAVAAIRAAEEARLDRYADDWRSIVRTSTLLTELLVRATRNRSLRRALVPASSGLPAVFGRAVAVLE